MTSATIREVKRVDAHVCETGLGFFWVLYLGTFDKIESEYFKEKAAAEQDYFNFVDKLSIAGRVMMDEETTKDFKGSIELVGMHEGEK